MIEFFSTWAKSLGLAIVIISILEMLLPNNKTKKYIRMVMGIYVLFTIVSPFIENKDKIDISNIDFENYIETSTAIKLNQTSMNERIEKLYIEELEKDITNKLQEQGYEVTKCKIEVTIADTEQETQITKIKLNVKKSENKEEQKVDSEKIENKIVTEIQKIKPIDTKIATNENEKNEERNEEVKETNETKITKEDIKNIKKFLIEEYEVDEKCLQIN